MPAGAAATPSLVRASQRGFRRLAAPTVGSRAAVSGHGSAPLHQIPFGWRSSFGPAAGATAQQQMETVSALEPVANLSLRVGIWLAVSSSEQGNFIGG